MRDNICADQIRKISSEETGGLRIEYTKERIKNKLHLRVHTFNRSTIPFSIQVLKKSMSSLQFSRTYLTFKHKIKGHITLKSDKKDASQELSTVCTHKLARIYSNLIIMLNWQ